MQVVENKNDTGIVVAIDDKHFVNCHFKKCTLIYSGGDCNWTNSTFIECQVQLQGAAQRTAFFMGNLGMVPPRPGQVVMMPPQSSGGPIN